MDEVRKHVLGAKGQEGKMTIESKKSLSIMIHFDEERLPMKLYARYMSCDVWPYIPPPFGCFSCQKYGHVAAICRDKQRCGTSARENEYGKCDGGSISPRRTGSGQVDATTLYLQEPPIITGYLRICGKI